MRAVCLPDGFRLERLSRLHRRSGFTSGEPAVDSWLRTKALQNQEKHLSVTTVLLDDAHEIAGSYTLATGQVDFGDLPIEFIRRLPRRMLPVAVLAWLGVSQNRHGSGLGRRLLAQALRDCFEAGRTFPFVAVILDCINDKAKAFYRRWDFRDLPGHPYRLFLSTKALEAMMTDAE
ncbi:MAG: GNAT family N-acetyltransferase [Candidatus Riflebacteria bacterium]|nr:GNAT family N-acetyltransferase [Candidatus Riflebacteria bacterium]